MGKQFLIGLIVGIIVCGIIGGIIGISMVGKKATVEPSDIEAFMINKLKNMKIPESSSSAAAVVSNTDENILSGGEHYGHHCAVCHDLEGDADSLLAKAFYPPVADLTADYVQKYTDGQLKWIVENGIRFTGMPGWKDMIDDATQWKIVYYMRVLADPERAELFEDLLKDKGMWKVDVPSGGEHEHEMEAGHMEPDEDAHEAHAESMEEPEHDHAGHEH
jgi:mono/diheme cytochrome c family protein